MKTELETLFNKEHNKIKLELLNRQLEQKKRWDADLKKINEIYDKLYFLNNKGIKVEKVCCTEFNEKDAINGYYPYLRLPQFLATFQPIHNDKDFDFGGRANGFLSGKFNCETLIIKILKRLN
jgi:hypothetical protein